MHYHQIIVPYCLIKDSASKAKANTGAANIFVLKVEDIDLMTHFYYNGCISVTVRAAELQRYSPEGKSVGASQCIYHLSADPV